MVREASLLPLLLLTLLMNHAARASEGSHGGGYAIVVSEATHADAGWQSVVGALVKKHHGKVVTYRKEPQEALSTLQADFPRYTCFVATPKEAGRAFVAAVHQLTRAYDDDPYTDTRWGILTGYDTANALAIAEYAEPLLVHKVLSGTDVELEACVEGMWYDELVKNRHVRKEKGGKQEELQGPDDTTEVLVEALNEYHPDLVVTSGHATERGWQIGFRYENGFFQCRNGQLFGRDTQKKEYSVDSPNAKIYMPIGNCLMGHVNGPDAMALAWMNSAGVKQMLGYTVSTWFGYGGWGVLDYFVEQPGRYTFQEAFLANHHALVHRLSDTALAPRDRKGLEYDRDTVAFYGDPAWEARMEPGPLWYDQTLTEKDGMYTLTISPNRGDESFDTVNANGSQRGGRPFVSYLPQRLKDVNVVAGEDLAPIIADDFILVPRPSTCDPERTYRVVFTGSPVRSE
jgi:zinc protease